MISDTFLAAGRVSVACIPLPLSQTLTKLLVLLDILFNVSSRVYKMLRHAGDGCNICNMRVIQILFNDSIMLYVYLSDLNLAIV